VSCPSPWEVLEEKVGFRMRREEMERGDGRRWEGMGGGGGARQKKRKGLGGCERRREEEVRGKRRHLAQYEGWSSLLATR
jgi:hypothetical protein